MTRFAEQATTAATVLRRLPVRLVAALLVALMVVAGAIAGYRILFGPMTISAIFKSATGIYTGDAVRVSGVKVGTVTGIEPQGATVRLTMAVDHGVSVPADAKAVVVAQNLVAARYVQLTPAYRTSGPRMGPRTVIPIERTAVPVEWDEVKAQLARLATEVGPRNGSPTSSVGQFIDSAANALDGNGARLRETLAQLSGVARVLGDGSGNIVDIINNLQTFVSALRNSTTQIVQFEDRLATLSSVVDGSRSDLDAALTNLSAAVGDVQRFVAETRDKASEQVQRLANVTQTLVNNKKSLEQLLHVFPTTLGNFYNIFDPVSGTPSGVIGVNGFSNPIQFICGAMAGVEGGNPADSAKKCAEYLGPVLRLLNFNYIPIPLNPILGPTAAPDQIVYSEPNLIPGVVAQDGPPPPPTVADMLLPAERPQS
jgi:virulence factor Mce-like protein